MKKENHYCGSCYQKGERNHAYGKTPWNKGLTKETNERVKQYNEKQSITKQGYVPWNKGHSYAELKGEEWAEKFRDKMSCQKKGIPNYKRRHVTHYNQSARDFRQACKSILYTEWIFPILKMDNFLCQMCGSHENLEVHHIKPFRKILVETAKELDFDLNTYKEWPSEQFEFFRDELVKRHDVECGITLCKYCHAKIDDNRRRFVKYE